MSQNKNKKPLRHKRGQKLWPLLMLMGGGLLLIFLVVSALNKPSPPKVAVEVTGAPSLKVNQEKVDLGDVKLDRPVKVSFELMNVGDETLRFSKAPYIEVLEGC
jgi:hypothetical protein